MIKKNLTTHIKKDMSNSEIIKLTMLTARKQYKKRKHNYFKYINSNNKTLERIYLTHTDKSSSRYTPFDN